ncbi:MAG: response regulator [Bdellovibrionales bacterium]|nr:response regulator [Bdellovibrionales bacterium]
MDKHYRILIVEDEAIIAKDIQDQLINLGYQVCGKEATAAGAIEKAKQMRPDVVLMDIQIQGDRDGVEAAQEISSRFGTPIIFLTAHADEHTLNRAKNIGPYGYILKPFDEGDLNTAIQVALAKHHLMRALKQANEELDAFSYTVSHDLKMPLRHIDAMVEELESAINSFETDRAKDYIKKIHQRVDSANQLIESLLHLSQISKKELTLEKVCANGLVEEIIDRIKSSKIYEGTDFVVDQLLDFYGDRALLQQAIGNLIDNAAKYSSKSENPTVKVGMNNEGSGKCIYYVKDNGIGFDMNSSSRLFQAFRRMETSEGFEGSGVGLSIVKRIVQLHHGEVWAKSKIGEGSTFYFSIENNHGNF